MAATQYFDRIGAHLKKFQELESSAGVLLLGAAVLAMLVKNSPFSALYESILRLTGEIRIGALSVEKPLFLWVNDGHMAVFFFLIGMEIKRELVAGHLADRAQLALPTLAALGGIAVPAVIYIGLNWGDPLALSGWAIPTATDIAFALGILALLGPSVPVALKVFLMTLAILDDLGAIIIIACFYTANLSLLSLSLAALAIVVLFALNRRGVMRSAAYILTGIALWLCVLKSGVHATLAGVITALAIPARSARPGTTAPLQGLIQMLHPWVAFGILPLFAFVNAGVDLRGLDFSTLFSGIPLGIALGLLIGKQVGVFCFTWLAIKLKLAGKPPEVSWLQFYGVSILCGVGFTMSLFIGGLAFEESGIGYARIDRLGVLLGSLLSGVLGYLVLRLAAARGESPSRPHHR